MMKSATIDIHTPGGGIISPLTTKDAERVEELMASDYVQLAWQDVEGATLPAQSYIMHEGEKYSLLDPYEPEQKDEAEWSYRPQFQSRVMAWGKVPFFHYTYSSPNIISAREPDWTLTDTPANFMAAICRAIKHETGETWTYQIAADLVGLSATISFSATDILSGMHVVSEEFETEWRADKQTNTLYLGRAQFGTAVTLEVGTNVSAPSVTKNKEGYYNRFYVYGSTRNITQDYQGANVNSLVNKRLTLDPAKYPGGYIDIPRDNAGGGIYSKVLTFDDVYPHSGLTISNLRARLMYRLDEEQNKIQVGTDAQGAPVYDMYTIWFFQLPNFVLNDTTYSKDNPTGMLIAGKSLSCHFKSGALTGREFELIYHPKAEQLRNSDGQDFSVLAGDYEIKFKEESGFIIPMQSGIVPADGDEVILFNLRMPAEYIATAYEELEETALKEIEERYTTDLNNYTFDSNAVAFATADPNLCVGRAANYINPCNGYSLQTRVIKVVKKLDIPSEQQITIGNAKVKGQRETLKEEVVTANSNIDLLTQLNQLNQSAAQAYQRTQQMLLDGLAKMSNLWEPHPTIPDAITTRYNVLAQKEVTAYANGLEGGSGGSGAGATRLRMLEDVLLPLEGIADGSVLTYDAEQGMWVNRAIKQGLDESALAQYLSNNQYARLSNIPSLPDLSIYATEEWVLGRGYALASALDDYVTIATSQEVTGQKRFTQSILLGSADDHVELSYSGGAFRVSKHIVGAGEITAYGSADFANFGGARALDDLTDVSLGAVATGDALVWDGSKWTNQTIAAGLDVAAGDARWVKKSGDIMTGALAVPRININAAGSDGYITADSDCNIWFNVGGRIPLVCNSSENTVRPALNQNGVWSLGSSSSRWSAVYAGIGNFSSYLMAHSGATTELQMGGGNNGYVWFDCRQNGAMVNNFMMFPTYTEFSKTIRTNGISSKDGNGLLSYCPSDWSGVSDTQWGLGSAVNQGVIRSNNSSLIHYRHGVGNSTIWDSSNDGSWSGLDADLLDGLHNGEVSAKWLVLQDTRNENTLPNALGRSVSYHFKYNTADGLASGGTFHSVLHFAQWGAGDATGGFAKQLAFGDNGRMYLRAAAMNATSWGAWNTIAFTSDNVASASKLATARKLWGNDFNGESDVTDNITFPNAKGIYGTSTTGVTGHLFNLNSNNDIVINWGFRESSTVGIHGKMINFGIGGTTVGSWTATGLGIGTTTPAYKVDVAGSIIADSWVRTRNATGWYNETYGGGIYMTDTTYVRVSHNKSFYCPANILAAGEVTAYSDIRLKQDIRTIERGARLRPVTFIKDGTRHVGLIAQEVEKLCPEAVSVGDDPMRLLSLNYSGALAYGFAGVYSELDGHERRINELERENQQLRSENETMRQRLNTMERRIA